MNMFTALQENICSYPVLATCILRRKCFYKLCLFYYYIFNDKSKSYFNLQTQHFPETIVAYVAFNGTLFSDFYHTLSHFFGMYSSEDTLHTTAT